MDTLSFIHSRRNIKLNRFSNDIKRHMYTFSLPIGYTCPFAKECKTFVTRDNRLIENGIIRCFYASNMQRYSNCRLMVYRNYDLLIGAANMTKLIQSSLPRNLRFLRLHVSGDFFNQEYFDSWLTIANQNPEIIIYGYTKSIVYWVKRINDIPDNFRLVASYGGLNDDLISKYNLRYCKIILPNQALNCNLPVQKNDDTMALIGKESFAVILHGTQHAGVVKSIRDNTFNFDQLSL